MLPPISSFYWTLWECDNCANKRLLCVASETVSGGYEDPKISSRTNICFAFFVKV